MSDRLTALVVKDEEFVRDELAAALEGKVRFTEGGSLILDDGFPGLSTAQKVACILLACRAAHLLGLRNSSGATPGQVVEMSGMAPGSVRPKLSQLAKQRLVAKEGSEYVIPTHAGRKVATLVAEGA
ncbi:MAG: hypothetical protein M3323_13465 [Actinomycetota bacterium]|nr:hypothetical protein [Actinomycetota bacterium]